MSLPVDKLEFWRDRVVDTLLSEQHIHNAIYKCDFEVWQNVQNVHREVLQRVLRRGTKVLDAGCGYGALCEIVPAGVEYIGLDFSPELLAVARLRYPQAQFIQADLRDLSTFRDYQFDVAICRSIEGTIKDNLGNSAWEHIEAQISRVAKKLLLLSYGDPSNYTIRDIAHR